VATPTFAPSWWSRPGPTSTARRPGPTCASASRAWTPRWWPGPGRAQLRLCGRFRRLAARKDSKNVVVTAIARELAGFLWRRWRPKDPNWPTVTAEIGATVTASRTPRRDTVAAGPIPVSTMRRPHRRGLRQGHLPASSRPAVPTRVHQCGGSPIHHARRGVPTREPGRHQRQRLSASAPKHPEATFALRAPAPHLCRNPAIYQAKRRLDKPLHISTAAVDRGLAGRGRLGRGGGGAFLR
jgi:hypothetical protein